jgi:hypothetical protein
MPWIAISFLRTACVQSVVELWVINVDFMGVDADYGSVCFMKLSNLPDIFTGLDDLVVEFVPKLNRK